MSSPRNIVKVSCSYSPRRAYMNPDTVPALFLTKRLDRSGVPGFYYEMDFTKEAQGLLAYPWLAEMIDTYYEQVNGGLLFKSHGTMMLERDFWASLKAYCEAHR